MSFSFGRTVSFVSLAGSVLVAQLMLVLISVSLMPQSSRQITTGPSVLGYHNQATKYLYISDKNGYSSGGLVSLASTDEPVIAISSWNMSGTAEIELYKADVNTALAYLTHNKEGMQTKSIDVSSLPLITKVSYTVTNSSGEPERLTLPLEENGVWVVKISISDVVDYGIVVRSTIGSVAKQSENQLLFWTQNFANKRVVESGSIKVYNLQDEAREVASGSINDQGIATAPVLSEADVAVVEANNSQAILPLNQKYINAGYSWAMYQQRKASSRFFTFTDRPVYQPGDTIFYKSVIRNDDDARYSLPTGKVNVWISQGYGDDEQVACESEVDITENGSVDGKCELPADITSGYYSLHIQRPESSENNGGTSYAYLQIENYRKPEYFIDVKVDDDSYIAGDSIKYTISGAYFFGQPLANQRVTYQVFTSDYWQYDYYQEMATAPSDEYGYHGYYGNEIQTGEVTLDANGEAVIEIPAQGVEGKNQVVGLEATVTDETQNASFARKNVLVYAGTYGIYKKDYSSMFREGEKASVSLVLKSWEKDTKISGIEITTTPIRETWVPEYNDGEKYPKYHKETETLSDIISKSNKSGEVVISFTPPKYGSYSLNVVGEDDRGNSIIKKFYIWVAKPGEPLYSGEYAPSINLQLNQAKYNPTDTAKLTINSQIADRDMLMSLERGSVHRYQTVRLNGKETTVDIPLQPTDTPNMNVAVSSFSHNDFETGQIELIIPPVHKQLKVTIEPDRMHYGPGDEVKVNLSATNLEGKPQAAELTLWAVDKAIFELAASNLGDIHSEFWSKRYSYVPTSHSLEGVSGLAAEAGGGCFTKDTKISMADGSKKLISEIKAGDVIKTRISEANSSIATAKVTGIHQAEADGYLIINGALKVTSNHIMWVNNRWQAAGNIQVGDHLVNEQGKVVTVSSLEWQTGKVAVYNLEVEKYHTFFAQEVWVHNQKDGGGREIFKDTAYWNPQIKTDANGKAQIRFKLPDNLTTWTIAAVGATNDTIVGQAVKDVVVSKSVIVRPVFPNLIRLGDEMEVSALVHNYTDQDHQFQVSMVMSDALVENSTQSASIKADGQTQVTWKIKPIQVSSSNKAIVAAWVPEDKTAADQVTLVLPVIPYGYWQESATNQSGNYDFEVKLADDADPKQSTVNLSLAPTLMGNVLTALESLVDYPYGCSEQTATKLYAALLAKENGLIKQELSDRYDFDELVKVGLDRLKQLQHNDGGWGWWQTGSSDPFITAYIAEVIAKAKLQKYDVDSSITSGLMRYYYESFKPQDTAQYVLYVYGDSFVHTDRKLPKIEDVENVEDDLLAMAAFANLKNGHGTSTLELLVSRGLTQGDGMVWRQGDLKHFGSEDTTTGLALNALVMGGSSYEDVSAKAMWYLLQSRHQKYWSHTFASIQSIKGLLAYAKAGKELTPNFSYTVTMDGQTLAKGQVTSKDQIIKKISIDTQTIKKTGSALHVAMNGTGQLYSTLSKNEWRTSRNTAPASQGIALSRRYMSSDGKSNRFVVGDIVTVEFTIGDTNGPVNYVVIEDQLPAGLVPVNTNLKNEQANADSPTRYYDLAGFQSTKSGAVLSLYEVNGMKQVSYKARVVNAGTYNVPPATARLMYAEENYAHTDSVTVVVDSSGGGLMSGLALEKLKTMAPTVLGGIVVGVVIIGGITGVIWYIVKKRKPADEIPPTPPANL